MLTVVLNPASGSANEPGLDRRIVELFRAQGVESRVVLFKPEAAESMIGDALRSKPQAVVAGGGDGTVSSVATRLAGGNTPLGILPLGTLNHFAKDLRIPLDLAQAVNTIAAGHLVAVDVGRVNNRAFINNSSIGIYPSIVETREHLRRQGHRKWTAFVLATASILARNKEVFVRLDARGTHIVTRTPFVFVGNNEYQVTGIRMGARARLDGGRLFAYLAPRVKTRQLPKLVALALAGRVSQLDAFAIFSAAEMWIETPGSRRVSVSIDGEVALMTTPLHYRSVLGALNVFVPLG